MYHRVAEDSFDPWGLSVPPDMFREQMRWLQQNRAVLPLDDFARLHREQRLPDEAIAVTFDDGYACNAEVAAPILEEFGIPATIFLPASLIGSDQPFWWDELESLVLHHDSKTIALDGEAVEIGEKDPTDRRWIPGSPPRTPRQKAFIDLHAHLVQRKPAAIENSMRELRSQSRATVESNPLKRPMTAEQVRTASSLITFGSHALTHPWLPGLDSDEQAEEICGSIERCRELTGYAPTTFAYPFGARDQRSENLASHAGFACACTTQELAVSSRSRSHALPRVAAGAWHPAQLGRALARIPAE